MWSVDPATGLASAKNYEPLHRPRRQDWNGELIENGAFYMTKKEIMQEHKCRLGGKMCLHEMEEHTLTELDSLVDWQVVTNMASDYGYWPPGVAPPSAGGAAAAARRIALAAAALAAGVAVVARLSRR